MNIERHSIHCSRLPGLTLNLRRKSSGVGGVPLLLVHGLSLPSHLNYDMPFDGKSAADLFVEQGIDCWMLDLLGYGASSRYPEQSQQPLIGDISTFEDVLADIIDAVQYIGSDQIDLMGWSGSAVSVMMLAARSPKIRKLVVYSPSNSFHQGKDYMDDEFMTYRPFEMSRVMSSRISSTPANMVEVLFPSVWQQQWEAAISAELPMNVPQGTENDRRRIRRGLLDLSHFVRLPDITCDCMFVRGVYDTPWLTDIAREAFDQLGSKNKRFEIADGGHWNIMETNRQKIINTICDFLRSE